MGEKAEVVEMYKDSVPLWSAEFGSKDEARDFYEATLDSAVNRTLEYRYFPSIMEDTALWRYTTTGIWAGKVKKGLKKAEQNFPAYGRFRKCLEPKLENILELEPEQILQRCKHIYKRAVLDHVIDSRPARQAVLENRIYADVLDETFRLQTAVNNAVVMELARTPQIGKMFITIGSSMFVGGFSGSLASSASFALFPDQPGVAAVAHLFAFLGGFLATRNALCEMYYNRQVREMGKVMHAEFSDSKNKYLAQLMSLKIPAHTQIS